MDSATSVWTSYRSWGERRAWDFSGEKDGFHHPGRAAVLCVRDAEPVARINVIPEPADAVVWAFGKRIGNLPITVPSGNISIRITRDGCEPVERALELGANQDEVFEVALVCGN